MTKYMCMHMCMHMCMYLFEGLQTQIGGVSVPCPDLELSKSWSNICQPKGEP